MKTIFLDGYNIINSWSELIDAKNIGLEVSRKLLIEIIQNYAAFNGYKIYIVFDAYLTHGGIEKKEKYENVIVVFTKEGETADSYIERNVDIMGRRKDILVVTSDSLEQQVIFQRGALRMSTVEFHYEVKKNQNDILVETKKIKATKPNWIEERIPKDVLEKLEKIRRGN